MSVHTCMSNKKKRNLYEKSNSKIKSQVIADYRMPIFHLNLAWEIDFLIIASIDHFKWPQCEWKNYSSLKLKWMLLRNVKITLRSRVWKNRSKSLDLAKWFFNYRIFPIDFQEIDFTISNFKILVLLLSKLPFGWYKQCLIN